MGAVRAACTQNSFIFQTKHSCQGPRILGNEMAERGENPIDRLCPASRGELFGTRGSRVGTLDPSAPPTTKKSDNQREHVCLYTKPELILSPERLYNILEPRAPSGAGEHNNKQ